MTQQIAGMVSYRMKEIEERRLAVVPGTDAEPCGRCYEKVAVSPAMYRLLSHNPTALWCWECLWEVGPPGINFVATRAMIDEALLMARLNRDGGPIH